MTTPVRIGPYRIEAELGRGGMAVVSEPLEADEGGWTEVPAASFCTFEGESVGIEPFLPCRLAAAA